MIYINKESSVMEAFTQLEYELRFTPIVVTITSITEWLLMC